MVDDILKSYSGIGKAKGGPQMPSPKKLDELYEQTAASEKKTKFWKGIALGFGNVLLAGTAVLHFVETSRLDENGVYAAVENQQRRNPVSKLIERIYDFQDASSWTKFWAFNPDIDYGRIFSALEQRTKAIAMDKSESEQLEYFVANFYEIAKISKTPEIETRISSLKQIIEQAKKDPGSDIEKKLQ